MRYRAILLDMMQTVMFGNDRFGPELDYHATYRSLGGRKLGASEVGTVIGAALARMLADYGRPAHHEGFRVAGDYLADALAERGLPPSETYLLDAVFAHHETGHVPDSHADAIRALSRTHVLVLVCNVWGDSKLCRRELARQGLADCFRAVLMSSDEGLQKPGAAIFRRALARAGCDAREAVMVGDDPELDLIGAAGAGIDGIWVNCREREAPPGVFPVAEIASLEELPDLLAGPVRGADQSGTA